MRSLLRFAFAPAAALLLLLATLTGLSPRAALAVPSPTPLTEANRLKAEAGHRQMEAMYLSQRGGEIRPGGDARITPPALNVCEPCVQVPDTCCATVPHYVVEAPSFSKNIVVGTREFTFAWDSVVTIYDLNSLPPSPLEDTNWATVLRWSGPGGSWNSDSLGSVFGLTVDKYGNIFVTHTSSYNNDKIAQVFNGGPGAIYRLDGLTGVITTFCRLPNYPDPGYTSPDDLPGLGNITYDCRNDQFFVTNMEDGRIYRIKAVGVNGPTGTIVQVFDPMGTDLGPTNYLNSTPSPGWAPLGERLWGVQAHRDRVFYSVWVEDFFNGAVTTFNEIRSVGLNGSGAIVGGTDQHELFLPDEPTWNFSMPVSDISFSIPGQMLLGERSMMNETAPFAHMSRVLEYECNGGCWTPANTYLVGHGPPIDNAAGGVDYDRYPFAGGMMGRVWASGDHLHAGSPYPDIIYGYQGFRPAGGGITTSILIDGDTDITSGDKTSYGDIECVGCPTGGAICGKKFLDTNHNGVKDGVEVTLPGWTITLTGPGGPYTTTTDINGNYCFYDLPGGSYTITETLLANWVQSAPAGGTHSVSLPADSGRGGFDFGNFPCTGGGASGCAPPPAGMVGWWPFNEPLVSTVAKDVTHLSPPFNVAQLFAAAAITAGGHTGRMLCIPNELDYAKIPNANQLGLAFGAQSFAIDSWVRLAAGGGSPRMLVEKRVLISPSPYKTRGWALYFNGLQAFFELGNGVTTQILPGPTVTAATWSHIAVSVDRATGQGRWYLNGVVQSGFNFVPTPGTVSSNADVYIGANSPPFGAGASFQGCIDDLEIFAAPLTAAQVLSVYTAGIAGKCSDIIQMPSMTTICSNQTSVNVCFTICNSAPTTQSYHWNLIGLPAGPGCTVGGIIATPNSGTITLAPGACSPNICVNIPRPAGLTTQGATSCFQLSVANDSTGTCISRPGTIRAEYCNCATPPPPIPIPARVAVGTTIALPWEINPCGGIAIPWRVIEIGATVDDPNPPLVSLNGLPPGEPVLGDFVADPGGGPSTISVSVSLPAGYDVTGRWHEIVLEADLDGTGQYQRLSSAFIEPTYDDIAEPADVPGEAAIVYAAKLTTSPNPFTRGSNIRFTLPLAADAELGVYDASGRLVRSLAHQRFAPGPHAIEWDGRDAGGRDAPIGMYFVRFRFGGQQLQTKLVRLN